jgi:hypothetical protein
MHINIKISVLGQQNMGVILVEDILLCYIIKYTTYVHMYLHLSPCNSLIFV